MHRDDRNVLDQIQTLLGEGIPPLPDQNWWGHHLGYALNQAGRISKLRLPECSIEDLEPFQEPFEALPNLDFLSLQGNKIRNLEPLAGLTNFVMLDLEGNQISDISSLKQLSALTELGLSQNQISDISPLQKLSAITVLNLSRNQISDLNSTLSL